MHGNGRPLGMRKRMQVLIAVVLLAWATQTLLRQWGYGAVVADSEPAEQFVPDSSRGAEPVSLELRSEATIVGADIKLKQVCRWSDHDAAFFAPLADLTLSRVTSRAPFRAVTITQIRQTLHDAGVNLALVRFAGPVSCTVTRSDADYDESAALRQWAEARQTPQTATDPKTGTGAIFPARAAKDQRTETVAASPSRNMPDSPKNPRPDDTTGQGRKTAAVPESRPAAAPARASGNRTLRDLLMDDLSVRLGLPREQLEVSFNPKDESLLNFSEPLFKFNLSARNVRDLGQVSWDVLILNGASSQKGVVTATARAWQTQAVIAKPLAYHQVIRPGDIIERRELVGHMPDDQLLTIDQAVGQEAAREMKVGTIVSARMIDPVPLVKAGQLVTITLTQGTIRVKTVGRALESGAYGQAVRVKNDATQDIFEVVMTGPQEGSIGPLPAGAKIR